MTPAVEVDHPTWCDAQHCNTEACGVVHHRSTPAVWQIEDGHAEVRVYRAQYDAHQTPEPTFYVEICRFDVEDEAVSVEWKRSDTEFLGWVQNELGGLN